MDKLENKDYDPLHPYSVEELLKLISKKANIFNYSVRLRSRKLEYLEKINHQLDKQIAADLSASLQMYIKFLKYTGRYDELDIRFMLSDLSSALAKENCFVF